MKKLIFTLLSICAFGMEANAQVWGDYLFYSAQNTNTAYLVDNAGANFKTWTFATADKTGYSSYLLPGGTIVRAVTRTGNATGLPGGPICGKVQKVDYSGTITWDYVYSTTDYCTHHDICPMPNGNVLVIAYERKTAAQVAAAGCTYTGGEMWPDKIVELKPTGLNTADIVWEWHIWDHACQNIDSTKPNYVASFVNNPQMLNINKKAAKDWIHMNGIGYNEELDQVTFTSHNQNEIYVIDHSTITAQAATHSGGKYGKGGDFLYRWGNPGNYDAPGAIQILKTTHDAHWAAPGTFRAGELSAYNNDGISTSVSCVDIIAAPLNANGTYDLTAGQAYTPTAASSFRHTCAGHNSNMGGCQQLPKGQLHVTVALSGKMYTVDSTGTQLFTKTIAGSVAKSFRYSSCYVNGTLAAKPTITAAGNVLTSSTDATYQWYLNGVAIAGATSQSYTATQAGNYYVQTTNSAGCESPMSTAFSYINTAIGDNLLQYGISIYPNPVNNQLQLEMDATNFKTFVYDGMGRLLITSANNKIINTSSLTQGMYLISIQLEDGSVVKTKFMKQ